MLLHFFCDGRILAAHTVMNRAKKRMRDDQIRHDDYSSTHDIRKRADCQRTPRYGTWSVRFFHRQVYMARSITPANVREYQVPQTCRIMVDVRLHNLSALRFSVCCRWSTETPNTACEVRFFMGTCKCHASSLLQTLEGTKFHRESGSC